MDYYAYGLKVEGFKRDLLYQRLGLLTKKQLLFFFKLWPYGPGTKDLDSALALTERTIYQAGLFNRLEELPVHDARPADEVYRSLLLAKELDGESGAEATGVEGAIPAHIPG